MIVVFLAVSQQTSSNWIERLIIVAVPVPVGSGQLGVIGIHSNCRPHGFSNFEHDLQSFKRRRLNVIRDDREN
jgi:hypothetical protein